MGNDRLIDRNNRRSLEGESGGHDINSARKKLEFMKTLESRTEAGATGKPSTWVRAISLVLFGLLFLWTASASAQEASVDPGAVSAASPTAVYDATSGQIALVDAGAGPIGTSVVWGIDSIDANSLPEGDSVVWGIDEEGDLVAMWSLAWGTGDPN